MGVKLSGFKNIGVKNGQISGIYTRYIYMLLDEKKAFSMLPTRKRNFLLYFILSNLDAKNFLFLPTFLFG